MKREENTAKMKVYPMMLMKTKGRVPPLSG
jgi:hypothetical protein